MVTRLEMFRLLGLGANNFLNLRRDARIHRRNGAVGFLEFTAGCRHGAQCHVVGGLGVWVRMGGRVVEKRSLGRRRPMDLGGK